MKRNHLDALNALSRKERQRIRALALERRDQDRKRKRERSAARKRGKRGNDTREWSVLDYELAVYTDERAPRSRRHARLEPRDVDLERRVRGPPSGREEIEARLTSRIAEVQRSALAVGDRVLLSGVSTTGS